MTSLAFILMGLVSLGFGGSNMVRGAAGLAERMKVSQLFIGLVLVGFGTSAPELVTSVSAAIKGTSGIALGNVIGSNIANILLVLGLTGLISPIISNPAALRRDALMLVVATLVFVAALWTGQFTLMIGAVMVVLMFIYITAAYMVERTKNDPCAELHAAEADLVMPASAISLPRLLIMAIGGMAGIVVGAWFMVEGSVLAARAIGVSDAVIGLTVVAVGTSLPEMVASATAAWRGETDLAMGNIIGSNIFNTLAIPGAVALVRPFVVPLGLSITDILTMLFGTALMLVFIFVLRRIGRMSGAVSVALYGLYVGYLVATAAL